LRAPTSTPLIQRLGALGYDATGLVVIGVAWTAIVAMLRGRLRLARVRLYGALTLLAALILYMPLSADVGGAVRYIPRAIPRAVATLLVATGASLAVPVAEILGRFLGRRAMTLALAIALGVGIEVVHGILFPESYPGLHLLGGVSAVVVVSAALTATPVAGWRLSFTKRTTVILFAGIGAVSVLVWSHRPSGATAALVGKQPTTVFAPYARRIWPERAFEKCIPDEQRAWFEPRESVPAIPSTSALAPPNPIVILLGVDSMRADILSNERYRERLPELFRLRDDSIEFDNARSPGSSTAPAIAAIFSGVYYSQLYWSRISERDELPYPWEDKTPRFPEALQAAGVRTITFDAAGWLINRYGIVRGFDEETTLRPTYAPAGAMESHAEARLQPSNVTGPTFLYLHFLDAHFPYGHGPGRPFDRYLTSLSLVDTQIGKLRAALESNGLWQRTILIVYADHGEAFGEHGLEWHGASLYDELVRVPLLVRIAGRDAAVLHDRVSLVDLGPTILDLLGVATPGFQMGESLVPLLRGEHIALDRPLVAEARLKRSLVMSGIKIIDDARPRGVEMYDLTADPGETKNLYDEDNPEAKGRYDVLRTFFDVQTLKRPGYEVPYRQW